MTLDWKYGCQPGAACSSQQHNSIHQHDGPTLVYTKVSLNGTEFSKADRRIPTSRCC